MVEFSDFSISPEEHPEFRARMLEAARKGVESLPKNIEIVEGYLKSGDAMGIVASVASYGLRGYVSSRGIEQLPANKSLNIEQHHAELLQAILLRIPAEQVGCHVLKPDVMQEIFDTLPHLSEAFFLQRILDAEGVEDENEHLLRSLQERVRFHTHTVRNWGYFEDVVRQTRELLAPLDEPFKEKYNFGATELIDVMYAVVKEYERRQSEHFDTLGKVFRAKKPRQMARAYYKYVPGLVGSADEFLAELPSGLTRYQMMGMIMSHFDLRLSERATFLVNDVSSIAGKSEDAVKAIFDELSLPFGALVDQKVEHLFLGNPVWDTPLIQSGDGFFIPVPQMAFSHIYRIIDRLAAGADIKAKLADRRAEFLEEKVVATFEKTLPGADVRPGLKWQIDGRQYETDLFVIVDRTVVIVEAKSHRLTPEGLRGAPERVKRHVKDIVLAPSQQSARLESMILQARQGDEGALKVLGDLKVDASSIDRVIRVSVTLDDFSVLSSAESDFKKVGWIDENHKLAPNILITDLLCLAEILNNECFFLHYLSERAYFQRSIDLMGDELDFLGLYLETGFNIEGVRQEGANLVVTGMSAPMDNFFMSREAGVRLAKPKVKLSPLFRHIIDRLTEKKPKGWTIVALHLLSCADPAEQKKVERALTKLRKMVRRNFRDPSHECSLHIHPPEERKARVVFYLFPEQQRESVKDNMMSFGHMALQADGAEVCVVFGRGTEAWGRPYESVLLLHKDGAAIS